MKSPHPSTTLALVLKERAPRGAKPLAGQAPEYHDGKLAIDATRVVTIARSVRALVERSCNAELTARDDRRLASLRKRADDLLHPYNLKLRNPWGLCFYAVPLDHDDCSETGCTFLA